MVSYLIAQGAIGFIRKISDASLLLDSKLQNRTSTEIVLATTTTVIALSIFGKYFQKSWDETWRDKAGHFVLRFSEIKHKYDEDINTQLDKFKVKVRDKWKPFALDKTGIKTGDSSEGKLFTEIPEEGWSLDELIGLVNEYTKITSKGLHGKHFSGTIYSKSLTTEKNLIEINIDKKTRETRLDTNNPEYFDLLDNTLSTAFTYAFHKSYLWNSLHSKEFAIGACLEYQVIRMVADMFGGDPNKVMGFVTSGGTESLMVAIRSYRNWGMAKRGHHPGEGVVIASKTVHAGILKAKKAYLVNIVLVDTDETGKIDLEKLKEAVKKYGNKVIAIVGSAPAYPNGVVDPIEEMALIAKANGCGMHVDCCLGAYVINNLSNRNSRFLAMPGVTSLSADPHKEGGAPKDTGTLITLEIDDTEDNMVTVDENLAYYSIYSIPDWSGGVYGTPKDAGSKSCVQPLNALLTMLGTGKKGYKHMADLIYKTTTELAGIIQEHKGRLKLIAKPEVNVVAFKIDEAYGLQSGATYEFAHQMEKRDFILNAISNDSAHFCVTARFASDPSALENFKKAVNESLKATKEENDKLVKTGKKFSGDAGMYGELNDAMEPDIRKMSGESYVQKMLLGVHAAHDVVRAHFLAQLNPY